MLGPLSHNSILKIHSFYYKPIIVILIQPCGFPIIHFIVSSCWKYKQFLILGAYKSCLLKIFGQREFF